MNQPNPELWQLFFAVLAQSEAALLGLVFVATSIHLDKIMKDEYLRLRTRTFTVAMIALFLQAVAVLAPQSILFTGGEIIGLSGLNLFLPLSVIWKAWRLERELPTTRIIIGILASVATMAGAIGLLFAWIWSFHVIAVGNAVLLVVLVMNAWSLMLGAWLAGKTKSS